MKKEPQVKTRTTSQNMNMKAIVVAPLLLVAAIAVVLVPSASAMSKCQECLLTTPQTLCMRFVCNRRLFTRTRALTRLIDDFEDDDDADFSIVRRLGRKKKLKKAKKQYDKLICCHETFRKVACRPCFEGRR